jgi:recombination protein RecR
MLLDSPSIDGLVEALRVLPGIGRRSAERIALHLLSAPEEDAMRLSEAVREARRRVRKCSRCRNLTESDPCRVCADEKRDRGVLCVVERPSGAMAIERGGVYRGLYHVLHGVINPLEGIGPDELGIDALVERIQGEGISEVIVATNATVEGENTGLYISRRLNPLGVSVSRIAHGVPMGGGLEFADDATLAHALQGRTRL